MRAKNRGTQDIFAFKLKYMQQSSLNIVKNIPMVEN